MFCCRDFFLIGLGYLIFSFQHNYFFKIIKTNFVLINIIVITTTTTSTTTSPFPPPLLLLLLLCILGFGTILVFRGHILALCLAVDPCQCWEILYDSRNQTDTSLFSPLLNVLRIIVFYCRLKFLLLIWDYIKKCKKVQKLNRICESCFQVQK